MQIKTITRLLLPWVLALASWQVTAAPLWEVQSDQHRMILGATVHFLRESDYPLPEEFAEAYRLADKLYLETNIEEVGSAEFTHALMASMMYSGGESLRDELSPAVWEKLSAHAARSGFPLAGMVVLRPALVTLMLTVHELERHGFADGVDDYYFARARQEGKSLGFLESVQVTQAFLEELNREDADAQILSTLDSLGRIEEIMNDGLAAWRRGDMDKLYRVFGIDEMRSDYPGIYAVTITNRHEEWYPILREQLRQPGTSLVLVGALHLAGPDSLLKMLAEDGYQIRPFSP